MQAKVVGIAEVRQRRDIPGQYKHTERRDAKHLRLSEHFCERWREYFGSPPPRVESVLRIIRRATHLQRETRELYTADGRSHKILSMYWDTRRDIVIKVDWLTNKVVTMITPESRARKG